MNHRKRKMTTITVLFFPTRSLIIRCPRGSSRLRKGK